MFKTLRTPILRPCRTSVALEEESVWIAFYRRVADPAIATEVIEHLDADAELKRTHPALYISCRESLRKDKLRLARRKRIRSSLRRMFSALFGNKRPPSARDRVGVPAALLPKIAEEHAVRADGTKPNVAASREPHFEIAGRQDAKAA
jgi:hypothetical protein